MMYFQFFSVNNIVKIVKFVTGARINMEVLSQSSVTTWQSPPSIDPEPTDINIVTPHTADIHSTGIAFLYSL